MVILLFSRGKMKRIVFQFTPYSWVKFEWKPASSLRRWLAVCGIIFVVRTPLWPSCPLLPGPATQAAALGMFLKLRPAGIPSQSCRTGAVSLGQVTDSLQKGLSLLAAHCSGKGSNINWVGFSARCCSPKHWLWVKVAQIPQFYAATGHITAGRGCIQGLWLL